MQSLTRLAQSPVCCFNIRLIWEPNSSSERISLLILNHWTFHQVYIFFESARNLTALREERISVDLHRLTRRREQKEICRSPELLSPFLTCRSKRGRLTGRSRTTQFYVSSQMADSLHGDSEQNVHHRQLINLIRIYSVLGNISSYLCPFSSVNNTQ